jgi:glycolate oxidase
MPRGRFELPVADLRALAEALRDVVGDDGVITERVRLRTYECDGLAQYAVIPAIVVLPASADEVVGSVRACHAAQVPFVARGSGTGLSGGALPVADGVLIVTSRLRRIESVDLANLQAVAQPGVINLQVTNAVAGQGYYYAPDPSSQQICSIGGNVAENSGGAHCLKYGFTTNHVLAADVVLPDGEQVALGGAAVDPPGYDLLGAFVGSEGTLGIATRVTVKLTRTPEMVQTLLAGFAGVDEAGAAVSAVIAAGVVPAAIEMMDALAIEAAEAATRCDYPTGAGAVLIIELDGPAAEVAHQFDQVRGMCEQAGAFDVRVAADDAERAAIWKGRKSAFASVGRISPAYYVQDGVIPRTALPEVLGEIADLAERHNVRIANVFHAGDGNLHPLVLFDNAVPSEQERAAGVAAAILSICLDHGGSITGEHGVGHDKAAYMAQMFTADDLDTMHRLRCAFDPAGRCNPGKAFPTPRLCGEVPGPRAGVHPLVESRAAEMF